MSVLDIISRHKNLENARELCNKIIRCGGADADGLILSVQFGGGEDDSGTRSFRIEVVCNTLEILEAIVGGIWKTQALQTALMRAEKESLAEYLDEMEKKKEEVKK